MMPRLLSCALAVLALACGGGDEAPAPAAPAQPSAPPGETQAQAPPQPAPDTVAQDTSADRTGLVREVFAYRGAGRDPFQSLLTSADIRPLLEDLRLTGVWYDDRYPARSVAVLRDVSVNKRYEVRADDELGRLRVAAIRPREVVFSIEEFGVTRQVTLALRKQEGIP
ncbi:MAG: hypothetical protein A3K13_00980 [Gemmatimonadetes bacterium RIFCSPLOWO2_12_FULL_68_9]|nr:MAG: hypothetical protein A3K13_00980 [Gemmatimonadetes bacterium RIFCSPLOWO2_12_FULL_68_9]